MGRNEELWDRFKKVSAELNKLRMEKSSTILSQPETEEGKEKIITFLTSLEQLKTEKGKKRIEKFFQSLEQ